jgi:hypothetical protein
VRTKAAGDYGGHSCFVVYNNSTASRVDRAASLAEE